MDHKYISLFYLFVYQIHTLWIPLNKIWTLYHISIYLLLLKCLKVTQNCLKYLKVTQNSISQQLQAYHTYITGSLDSTQHELQNLKSARTWGRTKTDDMTSSKHERMTEVDTRLFSVDHPSIVTICKMSRPNQSQMK